MSLSSLPTLELTMNKNEWNNVFAFGTNIYRTYSSQLPILDNNDDTKTLATKDLNPTNITVEPEEINQTIADNVIRTWVKQITGVYNQTSLYSNIATINSQIDTLITGNGTDENHLVYKLKQKLNDANGLTDATTTANNITRHLKTQLESDSDSSIRFTSNVGKMYHTDNILSNLVGDLSGVTSGDTDAVLTSGFTLSDNGSSVTEDAVIGSVTIRGGKIVGVVFSTAGAGYAVGDVISITHASINSGTAVTYTLVAGDLDNNGGFANNMYNFLFESGDSIIFQLSVAPYGIGNYPNQTSKNYAIKITMV
jgi:hypothetical protein